jgi:hypothetical protein
VEELCHIAGMVTVSVMEGFADTLTVLTHSLGPIIHPNSFTLVSYTCCSTDKQDLAAWRAALDA